MAPSIDILASTREAQRNVKDLSKAFDEVADAADEAAQDAERGGDKLERTFRNLVDDAKKAERAVEGLGDATADSSSRGFGKASAASGEFKSEALQNFSEIASSADGSIESIGEMVQGTLGGVASAIPGIGLAAGAAALGVGAITGELSKAQERSKEITDGIVSDFIEMGDALDAEAVNSRVNEILKLDATRKEAELLSDLLGVTVGQAALAMAGDFEAAGTTVEAVTAAIAAAPGSVETATWEGLKNTVNSTSQAMIYGKQAADAQADAMDLKARADLKAANATGTVTSAVDELGNRLLTLPDGRQIVITADTGQASYNVESFRVALDNVPRDVDVNLNPRVDQSKLNYAMKQLQDRAARGIDVVVAPRMGKVQY